MSQGENPSPSDRRNTIEGGNTIKKMNRDESSSNLLGQVINFKEASINNLPPEMLMEILKCVNTRSLFACRLVNRNFSSISSRTLCHRPDAKICFELTEQNKFAWRKCGRVDVDVGQREKELPDFVGCVKKSKSENFPFAHFALSVPISADPCEFFDHPDFTQFVSCFSASKSSSSQNQNQRIKGLDLKFNVMREMSLLKFLVGKLGNLIQNETPLLENLSLEFQSLDSEVETLLNLLCGSSQTRAEINPQQIQVPVPFEPQPDFQLPHLKVLRFKDSISNDLKILQELLNAAVNLKKLYLYEPKHPFRLPIALENFEFLQSLGKFYVVKTFDFYVNSERLSRLRERPNFTRALFNLELEELKLGTASENLSASDNANATSFISALFESQKDSVKKLTMEPLGILSALQFPTFKNLTQLKLKQGAVSNQTFFPRGVRSLDIFPAVRHLDLSHNLCGGFFHFNSIPILPSVKSLSVFDTGFTSSCISVLVLLCPNLKHLRIHKEKVNGSIPVLDFLPVGREIWRLMTGLESLEIDIKVDSIDNTTAELDSCFTGISVQNVQHLYQLREAESESESELTAEREHASILDMKSLTKLTVNHYKEAPDWWSKLGFECFYTNKLTWVSQEFAFKLMPNLQTQLTMNLIELKSHFASFKATF